MKTFTVHKWFDDSLMITAVNEKNYRAYVPMELFVKLGWDIILQKGTFKGAR